ncbi:Hypothetical protein RMHFA_05626 (plasmid) [Roseomonas mucosa]|nr:Hypothetical protein RMHFA_05626 [Roseomonas mucosa]
MPFRMRRCGAFGRPVWGFSGGRCGSSRRHCASVKSPRLTPSIWGHRSETSSVCRDALVEQLNQTWTFAVALAAARQLLALHPEAGGYRLAPGAHASIPLDIMSEADGLVGAETFAAVDPANNRKLAGDLAKMAARPELHRYVFFMSPRFPGEQRLTRFERDGVQVWSVDV